MRNQRPWIAVIFAVGFFVLPFAVSAAGLVPCAGTECQACDLAQLFNNIISFLLGLSIPIAMALFVYAGILYFTSAANPGNIAKARRIFYTAFFGFVIALGSYLIVDTILHIILDPTYSEGWNKIHCSDNRLMNTHLSQLLGEVKGQVEQQPIPADSSVGTQVCAKNGLTYDPLSQRCIDDNGKLTGPTFSSPTSLTSVSSRVSICSSSGLTYDPLYQRCIDDNGKFTGPTFSSDTPSSISSRVSICSGSGLIYDPVGQQCIDESGIPVGPTFSPSASANPIGRTNPGSNVIYSGGYVGGWSDSVAVAALKGAEQWQSTVATYCATSIDSNCTADMLSVIAVECNGRNCITNSAGATGVAQVYAPTACFLNPSISGCGTCSEKTLNSGGCTVVGQALMDPNLNIQMGVREWNSCFSRAGGNATLAAACYNGGTDAIAASSNTQCAAVYKYLCQDGSSTWTTETIPYTGRFNLVRSKII